MYSPSVSHAGLSSAILSTLEVMLGVWARTIRAMEDRCQWSWRQPDEVEGDHREISSWPFRAAAMALAVWSFAQ
jgi:hypothetical protein